MEAVIRDFTASDIQTVAQLEREIFSDPWSDAMFRVENGNRDKSWERVVEDRESGKILAYLVAWFAADEVHLANVAVVPEARKKGLAQRLLEEMEAEGRDRSARLVLLEVRRSNRAARELYKKNGYYTVNIRRRYYQDNHEDALVMVKPLNQAGRIPPHKGNGN